jgi:hypothetical protein
VVADYDSSQLLLLGKDGKSVQVLAENGAEAGRLDYPSGLALNKEMGLLFVRTCTWDLRRCTGACRARLRVRV